MINPWSPVPYYPAPGGYCRTCGRCLDCGGGGGYRTYPWYVGDSTVKITWTGTEQEIENARTERATEGSAG